MHDAGSASRHGAKAALLASTTHIGGICSSGLGKTDIGQWPWRMNCSSCGTRHATEDFLPFIYIPTPQLVNPQAIPRLLAAWPWNFSRPTARCAPWLWAIEDYYILSSNPPLCVISTQVYGSNDPEWNLEPHVAGALFNQFLQQANVSVFVNARVSCRPFPPCWSEESTFRVKTPLLSPIRSSNSA